MNKNKEKVNKVAKVCDEGKVLNPLTGRCIKKEAYEKKLKKERKTLNLSIFPNPILKLGDKVGVAYGAKYYKGSESYTITSINHSISNTGPTINIELKECV